jgi:hypothetical protein
MRKLCTMLAVLFFVLFSTGQLAAQSPAPVTPVKAGWPLDPRTGNVLSPAAVLIEDGKIKEVGSPSQVQAHAPASVKTIDLGSATLLPGLIDSHTHLLLDPPATIALAVDREISAVEKQIVEITEAMPEEKFNFSPESLNIAGSECKGVRTFAQEVKHVAASNYFIWSPLTGDKFPQDFTGGNGPENLKTKADILKFLKDSFALGHKAAATLTTQNMLDPLERGRPSRLHLATFGVAHAYDHYGQMVEYLRMNGIVPPASRVFPVRINSGETVS